MKIRITIIAFFTLFLIGCEDDDKPQVYESDIVGRWEFYRRYHNGALQTVAPGNRCEFDQLIEFKAGGTVTGYNPCVWNEQFESESKWSIEGNLLRLDYYVISSMTVSPTIAALAGDSLVIEQMYGETIVERIVYRRTSKAVVDYADEMAGEYRGKMFYSNYYIPQDLDEQNFSYTDATVSVAKKKPGNLILYYQNIQVLDQPGLRNVTVEDLQTKMNIEGKKQYTLEETLGDRILEADDLQRYNIRNIVQSGTIDSDSIYIIFNISKWENQNLEDENSPIIDRVYQYQRFAGTRSH